MRAEQQPRLPTRSSRDAPRARQRQPRRDTCKAPYIHAHRDRHEIAPAGVPPHCHAAIHAPVGVPPHCHAATILTACGNNQDRMRRRRVALCAAREKHLAIKHHQQQSCRHLTCHPTSLASAAANRCCGRARRTHLPTAPRPTPGVEPNQRPGCASGDTRGCPRTVSVLQDASLVDRVVLPLAHGAWVRVRVFGEGEGEGEGEGVRVRARARARVLGEGVHDM